jgi:hypothetical protein
VPGWLPTNNPNPNDRTIDMQWGFPRTLLDGSFYTSREVSDANAFYYEGSLIHEELHARYLLDNYGFNVHALAGGGGRDRIDPLENGASIVGTPFLPMVSSDAVYFTDELGMMNGDHSFMDRYGAMALNRIAGHRAVSGNMNAPGNFAIFINDLPADNELTLVDGAGAPLGGAGVRIYRSTPGSNGFYSKWFDATADFTGTADGAGKLRVGRNPFSSSALDGWHGSTIALMRVAHAGRVRYVFLEAADFNKEYWRGRTSLGLHTISVPFSTAPARSVPSRVQAEDYDRFFDSTAGNTGGGCRTGDVDLELTGDAGGGCNIGWTTAGEWVEFDVQTATTQTFDIVSRVASANAGKTFRIEVDGVAVGGTQTAPNSGWQSFQNRVVSGVTLSAGSHRIRVVFITGDVNLNYLDVVLSPGVLIPSRIEAESYVRFLDSTTGNSGNACRTDNVDVQTTTDPNGGVCNIGWTTAGEWLEYDVRVATTRTFSIVARLAAATTSRPSKTARCRASTSRPARTECASSSTPVASTSTTSRSTSGTGAASTTPEREAQPGERQPRRGAAPARDAASAALRGGDGRSGSRRSVRAIRGARARRFHDDGGRAASGLGCHRTSTDAPARNGGAAAATSTAAHATHARIGRYRWFGEGQGQGEVERKIAGARAALFDQRRDHVVPIAQRRHVDRLPLERGLGLRGRGIDRMGEIADVLRENLRAVDPDRNAVVVEGLEVGGDDRAARERQLEAGAKVVARVVGVALFQERGFVHIAEAELAGADGPAAVVEGRIAPGHALILPLVVVAPVRAEADHLVVRDDVTRWAATRIPLASRHRQHTAALRVPNR